jgi:hypothetical protein
VGGKERANGPGGTHASFPGENPGCHFQLPQPLRSSKSMALENQLRPEFRRERTLMDYPTNWCFCVISGRLIYFPGITSFNVCEGEYL